MVLEIPAYDSYYEVGGASENVPGPRNRESPDVESPPSLPSLIFSQIFSLLPDAVSLILFNFHCYAIISIDPTIQGCFVQN